MMKILCKYLLDFLFPIHCLHCKEKIEGSLKFCKGCSQAFELIDPMTRCFFCFKEQDFPGVCRQCFQKKHILKMAAACDLREGVSSLVTKLKSGQAFFLAQTAASLMAVQLASLNWPSFDFLVPIPKRLWHQRVNPAALIAHSLSKLLQVPANFSLKRVSGSLPRSRVHTTEEMHFYLKKKASHLQGKRVLLIDDFIITGKTFRLAAHAIKEKAKEAYCLAFARTM